MKKYLLPLAAIPFAVVAVVFFLNRDAVQAASTTAHPNDLFANFSTWKSSLTGAPPPILDSLARFNTALYAYTPNKFSFLDINGDNLPDFLYHENDSGASLTSNRNKYFAIFLNNGNSNFNLAYKCVYQATVGYFGDCAVGTTDPNNPANQNMLTQVLTLANYYYANGSPVDQYPYTHLWIDINSDGLLDFIDTALHINNNTPWPYLLEF